MNKEKFLNMNFRQLKDYAMWLGIVGTSKMTKKNDYNDLLIKVLEMENLIPNDEQSVTDKEQSETEETDKEQSVTYKEQSETEETDKEQSETDKEQSETDKEQSVSDKSRERICLNNLIKTILLKLKNKGSYDIDEVKLALSYLISN